MSRSQLFVGRLPIDVREREVEQVFEKYGRLLRCDVKYGMYGSSSGRRGSGRTGMAYAFVDYDDRRDAEDAVKFENGREIRGQSIVVEWARGPSYRSGRESYGGGRSSRQTGEECYRCRRTGHWARDCPELDRERYYPRSRHRSRSRSRSRSHRRRRSVTRSRSRSRDKERQRRRRSPSDYRQKSRSPSREKRRARSQSRSVSPAKSVSRSRSRSHGKSRRKEKSKKSTRARSSRKSQSRSASPAKSHSRSNSPEYAQIQNSSPPKSPEDDYDDKRNIDEENNRSPSCSPRKTFSRSPSKECDRSDNGSARSVSRSKSR